MPTLKKVYKRKTSFSLDPVDVKLVQRLQLEIGKREGKISATSVVRRALRAYAEGMNANER